MGPNSQVGGGRAQLLLQPVVSAALEFVSQIGFSYLKALAGGIPML